MKFNLDISYKNISPNYYINVFFNHREFTKLILDEYNLSNLKVLDKIPFRKKNCITTGEDIDFCKSILSDYFILSENYQGYNSIDKMKDFIEFIRFIEKVEMFENDPDNRYGIFCEEKNKNKTIYIVLNNCKIQMNMEETELEDTLFEQSILDKAIYGSNHVTLVTLNITRTTGKNMTNTFTFIYGDEPEYNDVSDELLLDNVMKDINSKMLYLFDTVMSLKSASSSELLVEKWSSTELLVEKWRNIYQYGFWI